MPTRCARVTKMYWGSKIPTSSPKFQTGTTTLIYSHLTAISCVQFFDFHVAWVFLAALSKTLRQSLCPCAQLSERKLFQTTATPPSKMETSEVKLLETASPFFMGENLAVFSPEKVWKSNKVTQNNSKQQKRRFRMNLDDHTAFFGSEWQFRFFCNSPQI